MAAYSKPTKLKEASRGQAQKILVRAIPYRPGGEDHVRRGRWDVLSVADALPGGESSHRQGNARLPKADEVLSHFSSSGPRGKSQRGQRESHSRKCGRFRRRGGSGDSDGS